MTDPLNDPRFPDRPTHADFWRLSEVVLKLDGKSTEGGESFEQIMGNLVDPGSVLYMAAARGGFASDRGFSTAGAWLDGFAAGVLFAQQGGHREEGK